MSGRMLLRAALLLAVVAGMTTAQETGRRTEDKSAPPSKAPTQAESKRDGPRNPRVLFITTAGCETCKTELARLSKPGGDFEAMKGRGWKIGPGPENHLQIIDQSDIPELVAQLNIREFPTVACVSDGEIVRSFKSGCTTPLDKWTFGFLLNGKNERPAGAIPEAARVANTGSYPLRGNHWSVDGDWNPSREYVISHLRGPSHGGQIAANYAIESWSSEELRSLHDDLHERELAAGGGSMSSGSYSTYGGQSLPSGRSSSGHFGAASKIFGR